MYFEKWLIRAMKNTVKISSDSLESRPVLTNKWTH